MSWGELLKLDFLVLSRDRTSKESATWSSVYDTRSSNFCRLMRVLRSVGLAWMSRDYPTMACQVISARVVVSRYASESVTSAYAACPCQCGVHLSLEPVYSRRGMCGPIFPATWGAHAGIWGSGGAQTIRRGVLDTGCRSLADSGFARLLPLGLQIWGPNGVSRGARREDTSK